MTAIQSALLVEALPTWAKDRRGKGCVPAQAIDIESRRGRKECEGKMLTLTAGQTSGPVSPVYVPDLRPTADAAAVNRQAEPVTPVAGPPAAAFPPVAPPSAVAQGVVGRSLLAAVSMSGADVDGGEERRLKPWGVAMLPSSPPELEPESEVGPIVTSGGAGPAGQAETSVTVRTAVAEPTVREARREERPETVRDRSPQAARASAPNEAPPAQAELREPGPPAREDTPPNDRTKDKDPED